MKHRLQSAKDPISVGDYGRSLGLSDSQILDALCLATELAGPGVGGRYIGPNHPITDDESCEVAIDMLRAMASRSGVFPL